MERTLLLTGFEPFGAFEHNPSARIADDLDDEVIAGAQVVSRILPVSWSDAWPALEAAMEATKPAWVLMLGLSGKRAHISVETLGHNACGPKADNATELPPSEWIEADGPDQLASTLPVEKIVARLNGLGLPVATSEDAGGYLCNYVLYKTLAWCRKNNRRLRAGFLHLPPLPGLSQEVEGMEYDEMVRAVRTAVEVVVTTDGSVEETQAPERPETGPLAGANR